MKRGKNIFIVSSYLFLSIITLSSCNVNDAAQIGTSYIEVKNGGLKLGANISDAKLTNANPTYELTYEILPQNATDKRISYLISRENSNSLTSNDFGYGKNPNDYLNVDIDFNRKTIKLSCEREFGTPIIIRFYSLSNSDAFADLTCRYEQKVEQTHFYLEVPKGDIGAENSIDNGIYITKKNTKNELELAPSILNYAISGNLDSDNIFGNLDYFPNEVIFHAEVNISSVYTDSVIHEPFHPAINTNNYNEYWFQPLIDINNIIQNNEMFWNELGFSFKDYSLISNRIDELNSDIDMSVYPGPDDLNVTVDSFEDTNIQASGPFYGFVNLYSEFINPMFNYENPTGTSEEGIESLLGVEAYNAFENFINDYTEEFENVILNYKNTKLYDDYINILHLLNDVYEKAYTCTYDFYLTNVEKPIKILPVYFGYENTIQWDPLIQSYL